MKLSTVIVALVVLFVPTACDMSMVDDPELALDDEMALEDEELVEIETAALEAPASNPDPRAPGDRIGHWECRVRSYDPGSNSYSYYPQCVSPFGGDCSAGYCAGQPIPNCGGSAR